MRECERVSMEKRKKGKRGSREERKKRMRGKDW